MKYCWLSLILLFLCAGDLTAQIPGQILTGKQEAVKEEKVPEPEKPTRNSDYRDIEVRTGNSY